MSANTRYLAGLWAVVGVGAVLCALQLGVSLAAGQVWIVILPVAVTVAAIIVIRSRVSDRRVRQLLQADSAEPLVDFLRRTIRPDLIPHGDAMLAQVIAFAHTLYADYPSTRTALATVNWDQRPPLILASRTAIEAMLCYFDTRDYLQGFNLATSARETAATPSQFPGARTTAAAYESYVEIGMVVCGQSTDATIASLERKLDALPTLGRLLVAWGLAIAYQHRGETERAATMRASIHEIAPHCRALTIPNNLTQTDQGIIPKSA